VTPFLINLSVGIIRLMTMSTGVGRGGRRENAGRPKGAKNKRSHAEELVARAKAEALTMPVDWLLNRLNDPELGAEYRDKLAAMVAPYVSPRLSAVSITKRPAQMSDEEIANLIGLTQEDVLSFGDLTREMALAAAGHASRGAQRRAGKPQRQRYGAAEIITSCSMMSSMRWPRGGAFRAGRRRDRPSDPTI
jgi:hypothetical protein